MMYTLCTVGGGMHPDASFDPPIEKTRKKMLRPEFHNSSLVNYIIYGRLALQAYFKGGLG